MPREYFHLYHSTLAAIKMLSDEERGRLFTALLEYSVTGETPELHGNERFVFPGMAETIRRDAIKYDEKCKKNRHNVNHRYHSNTNENERRQDKDKEKDKEEDKDKDKDKDKEEDISLKDLRPMSAEPTPYQEIIGAYNEICVSLPRATGLSEPRRRLINARYRDVGRSIGEMRRVFELAEASDFLCGRTESRNGRVFIADFSWIIKPSNFEKIREGRYGNRDEGTGGQGTPADERWSSVGMEV